MCAMMPMFRVRSSGVCRGITSSFVLRPWSLPAVVREGLIRFRHPMRVFALLHGAAAQVRRVEQLVRKLLLHRLAVAALSRERDQPADAERETPVRVHFDRDLVIRAADAARLHFEARLHVVERLLEDLERVVAGALLDDVEALVEDPLRRAPLAVAHHRVDELADQRAVVKRIRRKFPLWNFSSTRHDSVPYCLGRFAPYFDRPCLRPCTPTASSVPRTT